MVLLRALHTYKKPTSVASVDIDADEKAGQVVEPAREMHVSDMVNGTAEKAPFCSCA